MIHRELHSESWLKSCQNLSFDISSRKGFWPDSMFSHSSSARNSGPAQKKFEHYYPEEVSWALDIKCNLLFDWVYELSTFPLLLDIVSDLIGPDVLLTNSIFRIKEPSSSTHYGWHQDAARIQVNPAFVIVYISISDSTTENGCLRVIPGSNQQIEPFHLTGYAERQVARVNEVDESSAVDMVLQQGQVGIFDCNTIHGSSSNNSRNRRFALVNDYSPATAQQSVGTGSGQLVRGSNSRNSGAKNPSPRLVYPRQYHGSPDDSEYLPRKRSYGASCKGPTTLFR